MIQLELPMFDPEMTETQLKVMTGVSHLYTRAVSLSAFYGNYWPRIRRLIESNGWNSIITTSGGLRYRYTLNPENSTGLSRFRVVE